MLDDRTRPDADRDGTSTSPASSYSFRTCGRCRTSVATVMVDGRDRTRCPSCGRSRGWA